MLFVGPPGLGKTTLAQIVARELGVNFRATSGPGHRQGRRPRGAAHQSRRARRPLHRRDPPAVAGGRGNPLSGDGGFPARPHHRRRAGGAVGQDRPRAVHAGRRDDAPRPPDDAAPRPLRHSGPAQLLLGRGAGTHRPARRAHPRRRPHRRRRDGDRPAFARHAAHRRRGCLRRVRDFAVVDGVAGHRRAPRPTRRCAGSKSTPRASIRSTGAISS